MHMEDALLSPAVGVAFVGVSGLAVGLASTRLARESEEHSRLPLTGVLAAFVFAAQMVNFKIPGTGSSGHFLGGLLLAVLLGPARAMICMAAVLLVQAFVFGDGGILALGCNFFNMGLTGALVGWWVFRTLAGRRPGALRRGLSAAAAAWISVVAGSGMVVVETTLSGRVELPFTSFLAAMVGIHALIGIGEALITWGVVAYLLRNRPALFTEDARPGKLEIGLGVVTVLVGGGLSLLASPLADGLGVALNRRGWSEGTAARYETAVHQAAAKIQQTTAVLGGYRWTTLSGILGAGLAFVAVCGGLWLLFHARKKEGASGVERHP